MNNIHALPFNGPNGEAWLVWSLLAALGLLLVVISVVALWRGSRVHKVSFDAPKGLDWGKITGTFVGGRLVSIKTQYPSNTVGVNGYGEQGSTIERGVGPVPPLTVRNKKKSDSLLGHQITGFPEGEERQAANKKQRVTQQKDTNVAREERFQAGRAFERDLHAAILRRTIFKEDPHATAE